MLVRALAQSTVWTVRERERERERERDRQTEREREREFINEEQYSINFFNLFINEERYSITGCSAGVDRGAASVEFLLFTLLYFYFLISLLSDWRS